MTPRIDSARPVCVKRWQTAHACSHSVYPIDNIIQLKGVPLRVLGSSAKRGSLPAGIAEDECRFESPRSSFRMIFARGVAESSVMRGPAENQILRRCDDRPRRARLKRKQNENFASSRDTSFIYQFSSANQRIFRGLIGVVYWSLVRRRHRESLHHADAVTERTARNRCAKRSRAAAPTIVAQILTNRSSLSIFGGVNRNYVSACYCVHFEVHTDPEAVEAGRSRSASHHLTRWVACSFGFIRDAPAATSDPS